MSFFRICLKAKNVSKSHEKSDCESNVFSRSSTKISKRAKISKGNIKNKDILLKMSVFKWALKTAGGPKKVRNSMRVRRKREFYDFFRDAYLSLCSELLLDPIMFSAECWIKFHQNKPSSTLMDKMIYPPLHLQNEGSNINIKSYKIPSKTVLLCPE